MRTVRIGSWQFDPADPRAPESKAWDEMSAAERKAAVAVLPSSLPFSELMPPEGDRHYEAADAPRKTLRRYFGRDGRMAYVGTNLPVYYPGEPVFAPDLLVVLGASPHAREKWVTSAEGKGLTVVLEVHVHGSWRKDFVSNVERYARLGIEEYFAYSLLTGRLIGHRLTKGGVYEPIAPQPRGSRLLSSALGLELGLEEGRVRFYVGDALLPLAEELVERLEAGMRDTNSKLGMLEEQLHETEERAERAEEERKRAEEERKRAEEELARERERREALERELAALRARRET